MLLVLPIYIPLKGSKSTDDEQGLYDYRSLEKWGQLERLFLLRTISVKSKKYKL
jgi:hypothetical protein